MGFEKFARDVAPDERARLEAFYAIWGEPLDGEWAVIGVKCDTANATENDCDPLDLADGETLDQHLERRQEEKRRRSFHSTPTSTSTGSGRVGFADASDDPLRRIPASQYLLALAGTEVSPTGICRCPMPAHPDRRPSAKCYGVRWHCFACGASGGIYELGAEVYGLETTGSDFLRLRELIAQALLGVRGDV
jgi:hypothetical protein